MYQFLGIISIDRIPDPDLRRSVTISGTCRIIDTDGRTVELGFTEVYAWSNDVSDLYVTVDGKATDLAWDEDDEYVVAPGLRLNEDDNEALEQALCNAIYDIDLKASLAAEDAWNQVWVDAAVAAESSRDAGLDEDARIIRKANDDDPDVWV